MRFSLAIFLSFLFAGNAFPSYRLSPEEIYVRCFSQLTRARPAESDSRLLLVRSGSLDPRRACGELLGEGALRSSAGSSLIQLPKSETGRAVFETLQLFHASWFKQKDFLLNGHESATYDFIDPNEMAYHLSLSLFLGGQKYSDSITRERTIRAKRSGGEDTKNFLAPTEQGRFVPLASLSGFVPKRKLENFSFRPRLIERGRMYALEMVDSADSTPVSLAGEKISFGLEKNYGGGLLGSPAYILLNTNQTAFDFSDGAKSSHRRWAKAIMSDLFCRNLPVVKEEDTKGFVKPEASDFFRREATCMRCHTTMDPIAGAARNFVEIRVGLPQDEAYEARVMALTGVTQPELSVYLDKDPLFARRPASGGLYFRDYRGELINKKFRGMKGLGEAIASTDDYYICAAKKYFEFFTGIQVSLDQLAARPKAESNLPNGYRKFLIGLGQDLKKNQSLSRLLQNIFESPYYSESDYGFKNENF